MRIIQHRVLESYVSTLETVLVSSHRNGSQGHHVEEYNGVVVSNMTQCLYEVSWKDIVCIKII